MALRFKRSAYGIRLIIDVEKSLLIKDELIDYINNLNVNSKFKYDDINLILLKKNEIKENLKYYGLSDKLIKNHNLEYFEKYKY